MLKFSEGDRVLHPFYGTGTITGTQTVELSGTSRLYYVIDLAEGGLLMVPLEEAEEARLHSLISPEMMADVLSAAPQELVEDFTQRQAHLNASISSGDPTRVAETLRDLAWRDQSNDLSQADKQQVKRAKRLLSSLLVAQPNLDSRGAARRLDAMLDQVIGAWNA